jgi:hypothetical protein
MSPEAPEQTTTRADDDIVPLAQTLRRVGGPSASQR